MQEVSFTGYKREPPALTTLPACQPHPGLWTPHLELCRPLLGVRVAQKVLQEERTQHGLHLAAAVHEAIHGTCAQARARLVKARHVGSYTVALLAGCGEMHVVGWS